MNKFFSVVSVLTLSMSSALVSADEGLYVGVKTGVMNVDFSGYDTETPIAVQAGYNFSNNFALEGEYTVTDLTLKVGSSEADGDLTTFALYGVYRTEGELYGKFKAGLVNEDITLSSRYASVEESDSGLSFGVGAGYRLDKVSFEAEYTIIESDVDFISAAMNYHF